MSLLNEMLRDLSQHQPVVDGAEGYDEQLLQASSITSKKQHAWVKLSIFFIVVFVWSYVARVAKYWICSFGPKRI